MATRTSEAVTAEEIIAAEEDLDSDDVEKQLEAAERSILEEDDDETKVEENKSDDSEQSSEEDDESQKLSAREERLLELAEARRKLAEREQEVETLRSQIEGAESESDEPEEFDLEGIEVDESFSELAPALKAHGNKLLKRILQSEGTMTQYVQRVLERLDEVEAEQTRVGLGIDKDEEDAIVAYAKKNGLQYSNLGELRNVIQRYREHKELEDLRAEKAERENAKKTRTKSAVTRRTRPTSRQTSEEELEELTAQGDSYNRSFDRAVKRTLSDLKSGAFLPTR